MNKTEQRLEKCFELALPNLSREQIKTAAINSVAPWDSLATVNILALVEEEFGINVPDEDLKHFVSFDLISKYLATKVDVPITRGTSVA